MILKINLMGVPYR
jgi:hypothetical protein